MLEVYGLGRVPMYLGSFGEFVWCSEGSKGSAKKV